MNREYLLVGTVSRGFELLQYILFEAKDHTHLVSTMQEYISGPTLNFQDETLDEATQDIRHQELREAGRRGPSPLQSDSANHPPLAWTITWRNFYTSMLLSETENDIRC